MKKKVDDLRPQCRLDDPAATEKLAELHAKIAFGRLQGVIPPAPEQRTEAREPASDCRASSPSATRPPHSRTRHRSNSSTGSLKRSRLSTCVSRATWLERVADDLENHASAITIRHSSYRDGGVPKGNQIVEALLKDAEAAVNVRIPAEKRAEIMKLLRLDRGLLERFAVDGRNITANRAAKDRYGL